MNNIFILYPHQLFQDITNFQKKKVILVEEPLFFKQYKFHIQKLVLHRASMKFYETYLKEKNIEIEYFENEIYLKKYKTYNVFIYDVVDDWLMKKIKKSFSNLTIYPNPNFYNVDNNNKFLHQYYISRRKELNLFVDNGKPYGGKWSYDSENRKKLSKNIELPVVKTYNNKYIQEAKEYCKKFDTIGDCQEFYYPVTFNEAKENFENFLNKKFEKFGDYQDAIVKNENFVYHSNISSSLNIGLLNLKEVIKTTSSLDVPFNAKEGFIRQIIGWREFMFSVYKSSHISMRNSNFFSFTKKIPARLLSENSGLDPLDDAIKKLHTTGYNHHIERLMILGNIFLLLEINPYEVYRFFMSSYIDSYDWVMVANVYGMSQFSDGGSITTKPYISSSNYILKMSNDYKKSDPWCKIWDGLYWKFLDKYKHFFQYNNRMKMQLALLAKMDRKKLDIHKTIANEFLKTLK